MHYKVWSNTAHHKCKEHTYTQILVSFCGLRVRLITWSSWNVSSDTDDRTLHWWAIENASMSVSFKRGRESKLWKPEISAPGKVIVESLVLIRKCHQPPTDLKQAFVLWGSESLTSFPFNLFLLRSPLLLDMHIITPHAISHVVL